MLATSYPLTLGERGATVASVIWTARGFRVMVSSFGEEVPPDLVCNGVAAGDNPDVVDLLPAAELDVSCELSSGLSFRISLPGVERDGASFVFSAANVDAFEQCEFTGNPEPPTLVDRLFPFSVRFSCPLSIAQVSFTPPDFDFVATDLNVEACPTVNAQPCPEPAPTDTEAPQTGPTDTE